MLTIPTENKLQSNKEEAERAIWPLRRQFNADIAKHIVFSGRLFRKRKRVSSFFS